MNVEKIVCFPILGLILSCVPSASDAPQAKEREDLAGDEDESLEFDLDPCEGEPECAWWSGRLQDQGVWWELDEIRPVSRAEHCGETDLHVVRTDLYIPESLSKMDTDQILVRLSASVKGIVLGEDVAVGKGVKDSPGRVLAYLSEEGRISSAQFPREGVLNFAALGEGAPLDVIFDLDFGILGSISGRIRSPTTAPKVCRMPDGPGAPSLRPASIKIEPVGEER
jgi:hypothetical protein